MARKQSYDELDDRPATPRPPRRRHGSFFGFLSVLTGIAALKVVYRDEISAWMAQRYVPFSNFDLGQLSQYLYQVGEYQVQPYHVAAAGAGLAVLALLWRRMTKRTRAGWPVLGLMLCGAAAGIYRYQSVDRLPGTPEHWVQVNVVERVEKMLQKKPATPDAVEISAPEPEVDSEVQPTPKPAAPAPKPEPKEEGSKLFPGL